MLLGRATSPPISNGWSFEVKHDGWRAIADVRRGRTTIWSRNGYNLTERFGELSAIHNDVPPCVLDCELVVLDDDGRSRFEWIFRRNRPAATLFVFDVLRANGRNTLTWTIERRRALLRTLIPGNSGLLIRSRPFDNGVALLAECEKHRLEGIVAKRAGSLYRPGTRSDDWLKIRTAYGRELIRQRMENAHAR